MLIFLIGLLLLIYFSYLDIRYSKISNKPIILLIITSLIICFLSQLINLILIFLTIIVCYYLWNKKAIGGADLKIIPFIIPFLELNKYWVLSIVELWVFLLIIGFITLIYFIISKIFKKNKEMPYIPIILISYIIFNIIK